MYVWVKILNLANNTIKQKMFINVANNISGQHITWACSRLSTLYSYEMAVRNEGKLIIKVMVTMDVNIYHLVGS